MTVISRLSAPVQIIFKTLAYRRIGNGLFHSTKGTILDEELRLQNVQTIEFAEKICRGIGHWTQRIFRMLPLPLREGAMGSVEIEVVHLPVALIDERRGGHACCPSGYRQQC